MSESVLYSKAWPCPLIISQDKDAPVCSM